MKNIDNIQEQIKIDTYLNSSNSVSHFKEYYENFNRVKSVLTAKPFYKYKINPEFLDEIFFSLQHDYKNFNEIESKLIIFRDLFFYFKCFRTSDGNSILPFLTYDMLNFKYITSDNLSELKDVLKHFKFYIVGIKRVSFSYAGLYSDSVSNSCLYTFTDVEIHTGTNVFTSKNEIVNIEPDNTKKTNKSNLMIFEKALRCEFKNIPLLITDEKFDGDFFYYYKGLIEDKC